MTNTIKKFVCMGSTVAEGGNMGFKMNTLNGFGSKR